MKASDKLREDRRAIVKQMKDITDNPAGDGGNLSDEQLSSWSDLDDKQEKLLNQINVAEKDEQLRKEQLQLQADKKGESIDKVENDKAVGRKAFGKFLRGDKNFTEEERTYLSKSAATIPGTNIRAQSVGTDSAGGYTVPEDFSNELDRAMLHFGGMREVARVVPTSDGADLPWPTNNDTGNVGAILGENTAGTEQDTTFGVVTFNAYMYYSRLILVSLQLIQDSAFDVEGLIRDILAERLARILNTHFTVGTGTGQPNGAITAATVSTASTPAASALTRTDILNLIHDVDIAYRRSPSAALMMNDSTLKAIKLLSIGSSDDRPLWVPSMRDGAPSTIEGFRYVVNNDMAAIGTTNKSLAFGDWSKYIIRDVLDLQMVRFGEKYMNALQIGFMGYRRHDGDLIDAGTNPIKVAQHA